MKLLNKVLLVAVLVFSGHVAAADLSSAKASGVIGEQANGYIGFVKTAPDDVKKLVADVNNKRKARYKSIAKSKGLALSDVEKIAGKKAMDKTLPGNYIKASGSWVKK